MTAELSTTRCYIEEYQNEMGQLSARLRQKYTAKKVDLGFTDAVQVRNFLLFLSGAKQYQADISGAFDRYNDQDCILVSGDLDFDAPDEIRYIPNARLSYFID